MQDVSAAQQKAVHYVPFRTTLRPSISLSTEEICLLASMCAFVAFNLQNAENANFFNILTIVPGAVFTFKCLVMNCDRSLIVLFTITAYWLFFLIAIFNGYMYNKEDSYINIRLMLLGTLGAKAYYKEWFIKNREVDESQSSPTGKSEYIFEAYQQNEFSLQKNTSTAMSPQESSTIIKGKAMKRFPPSTAPQYDSVLHASTPSQTKDSVFKFYEDQNNIMMSETDHISTSREKTLSTSLPGYENSSFRKYSSSPYTTSTRSSNHRTTTTTMLERTGLLSTGIPAVSEKVGTTGKLDTGRKTITSVDHTQKTTDKQRTTGKETKTNEENPVISYGDIITNPMVTMKFSKKELTRKLTVTNIANRTIMWALKATTMHNFNALPAHGILHPGIQQGIIVCLIDRTPSKESDRSCKIAIDYVFVEPTTVSFNKTLFNSSAKKRHVLQAIFST
ncbi:hypothetical protein RB195_016049 [Necator americanus]|uniref:Major sperm protein n=1 Tax=Necator americanus TaxID=51031 RepID=A0ABR1E7L0_NECAM